MTDPIFAFQSPLIKKRRSHHIPVYPIREKKFKTWLKRQNAYTQKSIGLSAFEAKPRQSFINRDKNGDIVSIITGVSTPCGLYDLAHTAEQIRGTLSGTHLKQCSFYIEDKGFKPEETERMHLGWVLSGYTFSRYKSKNIETPKLLSAQTVDAARILAFAKALYAMRNLINTPANDLGPAEMESTAQHIASQFKADIKVVAGKALAKSFPLIHVVGEAAAPDRQPRLIDMTWGKKNAPKITLIGKGVCFDTGGLNLKPTQYMKLMKKDMGGAAHVLGVAWLIMALKLPVRLRVLIPAVENAVSGAAFRPGDILKTRKGLYVENTNTDAEGRLILGDALTYAAEENPDLIIDFATLTGSARAALGPDIPAFFSNNDALAKTLQKQSMHVQDPLWAMPLWQPYRKHINSAAGTIVNSASIPGDLIYSALFLELFLPDSKKDTPDWIHIDTFAWESHGHAGRPKGGSDCGLRAIFAFLESRYAKK